MYQNQASNLNRITAYYGFPAANGNTNNNKHLDDSNNASLYSTRKAGDDTLNKSQSSPKSPNTSELLIQNIGGKVTDLSKEVSRLMQINDKLLSDISILNAQNQNKDHLIKQLQENLNNAERKINNQQQFNYLNNNGQNNYGNHKEEKEEPFQQSASKQKIINNNVLQPRSGIGPFSNINNMMNQNSIQNGINGSNHQMNYMNEEQQRYILNSLQVNSDQPDVAAANFLFNSNLSQSGKLSAKNGTSHQLSSNEKNHAYNQIPTNPTSPWSINKQDEKQQQQQLNMNAVQPFNSNSNGNEQNTFQSNQAVQQNLPNQGSSNNKVLMLASFQDKQSGYSSDQVKDLQFQLSMCQEELDHLKKENSQLLVNLSDLKQKYEEQQKEHAREIAQLKTNMFNSVVESDNYSKEEDDDEFNIHRMRNSIDKNASDLVKSIEVDEKMLEGRFKRKENENNFFNNNSFSASKDQQQYLQKSNLSNNNNNTATINTNINNNFDHQTNLIISQEIVSKSLERNNLVNSQQQQQNLVNSSGDKNDQKRTSLQFIKRNSVRQGTINSTNTYKDNVHFLEVMEQLEITKKENNNLKQELKIAKEELLFISGKDSQAHNKNEQLRIIAAKLKLEQEEEIMKFKIKNEELQSEIKKHTSLNKNLQNEIIKLKEGLQSHQRSSTIFDEKTLENLFDSEIESDQEDLEDDGYGDRDSKQIRKHKNEILNTMTHNEKVYNNIIYLKRKNRRLEDQLQEWKRQYWLLEKSTQNHNHNHTHNHHQPQLQQQTSNGSNPEKSQFEFNFSQYLQYQQKASMESKKAAQIISEPETFNNENEKQKQQKSNNSSFQRNETPSQCDTPAIGISMNQGKADNISLNNNGTTQNEDGSGGILNKNNQYPNYQNQDQIRYEQQQQQKLKNQLIESVPKSANIPMNTNNINFSNDQPFFKQPSFSSYNPYNLNSNYQILKYDQYSAQPVTQFSPTEKVSSSQQNLSLRNTEFTPDHIAQITEEKRQLEKGVHSAIKDIRDQVDQLQKRKTKNAPQSQSQQQQILSSARSATKPAQLSESQKIFNDQMHSNNKYQNNKNNMNEYQKQYQSTSGMHLIDSKQLNSSSTTKISHLINNFKKSNLDKHGSPKNSNNTNKNLNLTNTSSNNTSQNMMQGNLTCQTDRQILYNANTQHPSAQSQSPISHQNHYQQHYQQKMIQKIASTATTTPKVLNAKHTTSIHQPSSNSQQQSQNIKQALHTQPNQSNQEKTTTFNNRDSANLSYETSKSQINMSSNINKSTSPINSKQYPKQIEQSYSNNFIYQKAKFTQRIKDKYN